MSIDPRRIETFGNHAALGSLVVRQTAASPRHISFLTRRFASTGAAELQLCDEIAAQILRLAGDEIDSFVQGYDFICDIQKREEIYFRRHQAYRLKTFAEAAAEVYSNREYMQSYMRGLLMTQVFWSNHAAAMSFFLERFLRHNIAGYDLLEIGPGHGLLFSRAAADTRAGSLTGWDLSAASLAESREALARLGVTRPFKLEARNLFDSAGAEPAFDAVVFSEVLEHMEEPARALEAIYRLMRPGARLYANIPVNSPAPDHLFLLRSAEEAVEFVRSHGFDVQETAFFPATNYTLEAARRHSLTITTCMVAVRSG